MAHSGATTGPGGGKGGPGWKVAALTGAALAVAGALGAAASGLGVRLDAWHFSTGFTVLRWSALAGLAGAAVSVVAAAALLVSGARRGLGFALAGIILGSLAAFVPFSWQVAAQKVPPIHDITTDTVNPPGFVKAPELRKETDNTLEYGGPGVAEMQKRAYPELAPLILDIPPDRAFDHALAALEDMGLEVVHADRDELRIEAVDTTFWFGFKDDMVVRITATEDDATRVDARSVSRVGRSDIGANAERITGFLEKLERLSRR